MRILDEVNKTEAVLDGLAAQCKTADTQVKTLVAQIKASRAAFFATPLSFFCLQALDERSNELDVLCKSETRR